MRTPTAVAAALTLALVPAVGVAGCGGPERPRVQGPAPTASPANGPVYASDAMGRPLVRPANFPFSEFAGLTHVKWRNWGQPKAVGTGELSASWCAPDCDYPTATIELTRLEHQENVSYYTRATVVSPQVEPEYEANVRSVHLYVPEP
ncbi:hypothetical protein EJ357_23925 [Streptomyces cyaneochromogenes]|uniref:Uncharacterized protein n=1 Tax=Streptomyces cyaneochromogenes TaxID=2496836 RepID=A0A3Q9EUA3_9ACTN|nr:hypothetical protein [Streptomyces cyaneochromogenes]AZQ36152.1 hypothetical protein EJ357_23925 [Streptomyces cyaneochromogenes]